MISDNVTYPLGKVALEDENEEEDVKDGYMSQHRREFAVWKVADIIPHLASVSPHIGASPITFKATHTRRLSSVSRFFIKVVLHEYHFGGNICLWDQRKKRDIY